MRVAFMGTPDFAAASLEALLASRHEVVCVVSQPDRRAGRGKRTRPPPVARLARDAGLPLAQPERVRTTSFRRWVLSHRPEVGVVAAFGHILGPRLLNALPHGWLNVHASLLPRWRGAAPIQMAILAGDSESGVTIMRLGRGVDTGKMLHKRATPIGSDDTAETLHDRLAALGATAIVEALDLLAEGRLQSERQSAAEATHAPMLRKQDGRLDWTEPATALDRRIRAFHPWPGTQTWLDGEQLKVLPPVKALPTGLDAAPGTVIAAGSQGIDVAAGDGTALRLVRLQLAGRKALDAGPFLAGRPVAVGTRLGDDEAS